MWARYRDAYGIGPEARLFSLPWRHQGRGIADDQRKQSGARDALSPIRRGAEVIALARGDDADAVRMCESNRVIGTDAGGELADAILGVIRHRSADFIGDMPTCSHVEIGGADLIDVEAEELHSVRIDGAQVGGDERISDELCGFGRNSGGG